jgi:putative spermidine/putrescine transport system substrate-binding protein
MSTAETITRRKLLKAAGAAATGFAMPLVWTRRARSAEQITVADVGGAAAPALRAGFYDPFEKETGIRVVNVAHESDPVTQFKLVVDTGSKIGDVCMVTPDDVARLTADKNYLESLDIAESEAQDLVPGSLKPNWLGFSVYAIVMAYRTDTYKSEVPKNWADFWNTTKFPGRRGLYRNPKGVLEAALLADGVAPGDLYPLDVDRAFAMLDKVRSEVAVWWTSGAQNTQILQSGEIDMSDTWSGRAFAAIDSGAPVNIVWNGLYSIDGWSIPLGTPKLKQAREFVRFCMHPERQATYSNTVANGPSNLKAYDFITLARAKVLPTYPENFKGLTERDFAFWGKNYAAISDRFQDWLLMGGHRYAAWSRSSAMRVHRAAQRRRKCEE